jgi:uncharacterized protein (DUF4415 family)
MKRQARVRKSRKISGRKAAGHTISRLKGSADEAKGSRDLMPDTSKMYKPLKKPVTLRLDADVLAWFKKKGSGYQTRINRALRAIMMERGKESAE